MKNQGKAEFFVRELDLKRAITTTYFVLDDVRYTRIIFFVFRYTLSRKQYGRWAIAH